MLRQAVQKMPKIAVFDVNETTLNLPGKIAPVIEELIGRSGAYETWFGQVIQFSMTLTAAGKYHDFGKLAPSALDWVAGAEGVTLPPDAWDRVRTAMGQLEAHEEVAAGLDKLTSNGWRLIAFSNSGQASVDSQLTAAGIHDKFESVLSVEAVQQFKPAPATYQHVLQSLDVAPEETIMVACHDWDLEGANAVGMQTAFVKRPGQHYASIYTPPDLVVNDFTELAEALGVADQ